MCQNSPPPLQTSKDTLSSCQHNPRQASRTADMLQREKTYAKTFSNYCSISKTAVIQIWTSSFEYGQYKIHNKKIILTHFLSFYPSRTMLCNFLSL